MTTTNIEMDEMDELLLQSLDELETYFVTGDESGVEVHTYILGEVPDVDHVMVKRVREELRATQKEFANVLGVSTRTVEAWEGGRSHPNGSATRLMQLVMSVPSMRALYKQAIQDSKPSQREVTLA